MEGDASIGSRFGSFTKPFAILLVAFANQARREDLGRDQALDQADRAPSGGGARFTVLAHAGQPRARAVV